MLLLFLKVFNADEEKALEHHVIQASKMFFGFSKFQTRKLAYQFALSKGISMPDNWLENEVAGRTGFVDSVRDQEVCLFGIQSRRAWAVQSGLIALLSTPSFRN